jgi:hypothetical protein
MVRSSSRQRIRLGGDPVASIGHKENVSRFPHISGLYSTGLILPDGPKMSLPKAPAVRNVDDHKTLIIDDRADMVCAGCAH